MLNSKQIRELAYLVKVDDVTPIKGYDRVELAHVAGWTLVVGKGDIKTGDIAVYFEIDSQVPDAPPFSEISFLRDKHFKIKTQKMCKSISQGLLVPISAFKGWTTYDSIVCDDKGKKHYLDDDSRFLTSQLNVTYNTVSDNERKRGTTKQDKYQKMINKKPYIIKNPIGKWLFSFGLGKSILFAIFGRDIKIARYPEWVVKTDEERCLLGQTKIITDHGAVQISKIVNQKLPYKVLSMNDKGELEYKKILDYQKFKNDESLMTISYPYHVGVSRVNHLCCTRDHKIYTQRGYVQSKDLAQDDLIYARTEYFDKSCIPAIYGMLLGDSHIMQDKRYGGNIRVCTTQGEKQLEYLKYKQSLFEDTCGQITESKSSKNGNAYSDLSSYKLFMSADPYVSESIKQDWLVDGKKTITQNVVSKLTEESLAYWYMDDGSLSYRNDTKHSPSIRLNTQSYSLSEQQLLVDTLLNKFNIKTTIRKDKEKYYLIYITTESTPTFLSLVTPYMCKSMAYKTLPQYEGLLESKKPLYKKHIGILPQKIISIENGQKKLRNLSDIPTYVYDIEVEENHNFFADGILTHNCQNAPHILDYKEPMIVTEKIDGTSTTFTLKRENSFKNKYHFYVCSRNVCFDTSYGKEHKTCYYDTNVYTEMAEKYNIRAFLEWYLDSDPKLDWVTLQGETYGDGIQRRTYSLKNGEHRFMGFNLIDSREGRLNSVNASLLCEKFNIPWVPILDTAFTLPDTVDEMLAYAHNKSVLDDNLREGVVIRSADAKISFKAVDNEYLLKYHG